MKKIILGVLSVVLLSFFFLSAETICLAEELPAKYDTRLLYQTPVKSQGSAGLCWNFATIGTLEASIKKTFGIEVDLSEEHWAYSMSNVTHNDDYKGDRDPDRCGSPSTMEEYQNRDNCFGGPVLECDDPYDEIKEKDRPLHCYVGNPRYFKFNLGAVNYSDKKVDRDTIKSVVLRCGSAYGVMVFEGYDSDKGEWTGSYTGYYNKTNHAYFYNKEPNMATDSTHAVVIAGWDDEYPIENFNANCRPSKPGAWLIKNSWDTDWGDRGYAWVSYEDSYFTRSLRYCDGVEKIDHSIHEYNNQKRNGTGKIRNSMSEAYFAKPFTTITAGEELESVKVYIPDSRATVELDCVQNLCFKTTDKIKRSKHLEAYFGDGREYEFKCLSKSEITESGFHTFKLDSPVKFDKKGTEFWIVVRITSDSEGQAIGCEHIKDDTTDYRCYMTIGTPFGVFWDGHEGRNFTIRPKVRFTEPYKTHDVLVNNNNSSVERDREEKPDGSMTEKYKVIDADGAVSDISVDVKNNFESHKERTTIYPDGSKETLVRDVDSKLNETYREFTKTNADGSVEKLIKKSETSQEYCQCHIKQVPDESGTMKTVSIETDLKDEKGIKHFVYSIADEKNKTVAVTKISSSNVVGTVIIPDTVDVFGESYTVVRVGEDVFDGNNEDVSNFTSVEIGDFVKIIDERAFRYSYDLNSVIIGKSVEKIGKEAFDGCDKLKSITIKSRKIKKIGKDAFLDIPKNATIYISGSRKYYKKIVKMIRKSTELPKKVKFVRVK